MMSGGEWNGSVDETVGVLNGLVVLELKELLRVRRLTVSGNKSVLVERLVQYGVRTSSLGELVSSARAARGRSWVPAPRFSAAGRFPWQELSEVGVDSLEFDGAGKDPFAPLPGGLTPPYYGGTQGARAGYAGESSSSSGSGAVATASRGGAGGVAGAAGAAGAHGACGVSDVIDEGSRALLSVARADYFHRVLDTVYACAVLRAGFESVAYVDMGRCPGALPRPGALPPPGGDPKVLIYCTDLRSAPPFKHEWPTAVSVQVNGRTADVRQQCSDGRHQNKALLERPCEVRHLLHARQATNTVKFSLPLEDLSLGPGRARELVAGLFVCAEVPNSELMTQMRRRERAESIEQLAKVFGDGEVVCSQMLVKLRDPISMQRIRRPAKGLACAHVQCFDAEGFFQFQRKARNAKWRCFVCNESIPGPADVLVDAWFEEVLTSTEALPGVDEVEYFQDGTYKTLADEESSTPGEEPTSPRAAAAQAQHIVAQAAQLLSDQHHRTLVFPPSAQPHLPAQTQLPPQPVRLTSAETADAIIAAAAAAAASFKTALLPAAAAPTLPFASGEQTTLRAPLAPATAIPQQPALLRMTSSDSATRKRTFSQAAAVAQPIIILSDSDADD